MWKKKNKSTTALIQYVLLAALALATAVVVYMALTTNGAQPLFPEHEPITPTL